MVWALLCGLFYGALAHAAWREAEESRAEPLDCDCGWVYPYPRMTDEDGTLYHAIRTGFETPPDACYGSTAADE